MNNLTTLRTFFELNPATVAKELAFDPATLTAFEQGDAQPNIAQWQHLAEYYADQFHIADTGVMREPIHFRLSVDYLMNTGITLNDLLAMQWYFANTQPQATQFGIALFTPQTKALERYTTELPQILEQYAGYLLLNHDGSLNQFIDERNNNRISDWRLMLTHADGTTTDVTANLTYLPDLPNYSHQ